MENLQALQTQLLNDVEPKTLIESIKPMSTSGSVFKSNWTKFFENKGKFTYTVANKFVTESSQLAINDASIAEARETVLAYLTKESVKSKLAIVAESTEHLSRTSVKDSLSKRIDGLLGLQESVVKTKLANGVLDSFSSMLGLSSIITEASNLTVRTATDTVKLVHPVSYAEVKEGKTFIRFGQYIFKLDESAVELSKAPSERFKYLSNIVEHTEVKENSFVFNTDFGTFTVNENGIYNDEKDKVTVESFISNSKVVIESKFVGAGSKQRRTQNFNLADAIIAVKENFASIVKLDNFLVAENSNFNERIGIITGGKQAIVFVESSKRYPSNVQHYKTVTEAIARFNTLTKVDVSERFKSTLEKEQLDKAEDIEYAEELQKEIDDIATRIESIKDAAKEVEKDSEAHVALEEALSVAKAMLVESQTRLTEFLASK